MDPIIKAKWVKALRSGEFRQVRRSLHREGGYCCLGVLCFVAGMKPAPDEFIRSDGGREFGWLSNEAREDVGLGRDHQEKLMGMNDTQEKSFAEIADYIEEHL